VGAARMVLDSAILGKEAAGAGRPGIQVGDGAVSGGQWVQVAELLYLDRCSWRVAKHGKMIDRPRVAGRVGAPGRSDVWIRPVVRENEADQPGLSARGSPPMGVTPSGGSRIRAPAARRICR
jgi:hypothetical protein